MNMEKQQTENRLAYDTQQGRWRAIRETWWTALQLGLTSFGGPIAHLGYFHTTYVRRKQWLDEKSYADLVALAQFLPGPASSQVGIGVGVMRAGLWGGIIAWLGFTLPSVVMLMLFAYLMEAFDPGAAGWIQGLKIVAVAIVAQAVLGMAGKLASGPIRAAVAFAAMSVVLLWTSPVAQVSVIAAAGVLGWWIFRKKQGEEEAAPKQAGIPISRTTGLVCLGLFLILLLGLPVLASLSGSTGIAVVDSFYRSGSLVFGGGHVVLPLLESETVANGWMTKEEFLTGYGATQAVPGPLFTFAGYLGMLIQGVPGGILATLAIFLPGFLLIVGVMPFWNAIRTHAKLQGMLTGMNAAVVGILLAALYHPIWTSSIDGSIEFVIGAGLFAMLMFWKCPPWVVVLAGAAAGQLLL
ncbi:MULTISPECIES: chromate efflux transporter [Paenibacillus]|jgi:chromate transporter|uniref:Chromate transporter n=1 Tax=Paenibacillus lactis TaxID=228574 RepID=A0ABS4FDV1_9BACL|nr:chromate efflux transporter [Paenibacillus lactis]MBP1894435.1 chromate transporter [Paenibacillus lactis]MCM3496185.1 chromate efflux transporter [Paenibacillus lactis]GIO94187.1 chromate transporter [Paenibacillus lactis]HAF98710.1 ChrA protein [Paenibacillus lactis]